MCSFHGALMNNLHKFFLLLSDMSVFNFATCNLFQKLRCRKDKAATFGIGPSFDRYKNTEFFFQGLF